MERPVDLATLSREELIGLVGQLLSHIEALEARIAELEGQPKLPSKPAGGGVKERKAPGWTKANRPTQPKKERKKRTHGFARLRDEPTHWVEHATRQLPRLPGRVHEPASVQAADAGDQRAPGTGTGKPNTWCWNAPDSSAGSGGPRICGTGACINLGHKRFSGTGCKVK